MDTNNSPKCTIDQDHGQTRQQQESILPVGGSCPPPCARHHPPKTLDSKGESGDSSPYSNGTSDGGGSVVVTYQNKWHEVVESLSCRQDLLDFLGRKKEGGSDWDQSCATGLGRPVWRWILDQQTRKQLRTTFLTAMGSSREARLYTGPCWRFLIQIAVGTMYGYDDLGVPHAVERKLLAWGPPVPCPWDVREAMIKPSSEKKKESKRKSRTKVERKRMVQLLISAGLIKLIPFGPNRCTRFRLRWNVLDTILQGMLSALEEYPNQVRWVNIVDGQTLNSMINHPLFESNSKKRTKERLKKNRQRQRKRAAGDARSSTRTPIVLAWATAVQLVRANLLLATALGSPRLRARAVRDIGVLHGILTNPSFRFDPERPGLASYVPHYEMRSAGRLYEQGAGFQTASREMKQSLALGDPRTGNVNYDLKSCHAWAYDALSAGLNSWLGYTGATPFLIDRLPLLDLLSKPSAWKYLSDDSDLPEDALKSGLYALLNGANLATPSYPVTTTDPHTGEKSTTHRLTAAGEIAHDHCRGMKPYQVARFLHEALTDVRTQRNQLNMAIHRLIEQGNMHGTRPSLRKLMRVHTHRGKIFVENAVGRTISGDERLSRIISHLLTRAEQNAVRLAASAAEPYGVSIVAWEHDGLVLSGLIPADAIAYMEDHAVVGFCERKPRAILRPKPFLAGSNPYNLREAELRALIAQKQLAETSDEGID